jgi:mono/diheme cytochrome c family protein
MNPLKFSLQALPVVLAGVGSVSFAEETTPIAPEHRDFFENKIRPILANHCLECHSSEKGKVKGGLNMDTREDMLKGGENGEILKAGDAKASAMIKAVEWVDDTQMPPKKKLSDDQIAALKEWVNMGAPDPREGSTGPKVTKKDHWAFQPISRPSAPTVKNPAWCKTSIDKFVLAKLEEKDMLPGDPPESGSDEERRRKKEALLRRAYFDLVGMPPSPQQIRDFTNDQSGNAFEKVIDQLLASPAYGERWARHWLDTARYSDTTGSLDELQSADYRYAYAWAYRDWVISAINKDMPYDQFVLNQLAADKVPGNAKENLAALGFLTVGQRFQDKDDIINDRIDVVGRGFLGLTLSCARCHDHKFDPIKQSDYYALRGVFASTVEPREGPVIAGDANSKEYKDFEQKLRVLEKHAYSTLFQMQREFAQEFRKDAGAFFEAAYHMRDRNDVDGKKRADAIVEKFKLTPGINGLLTSSVQRHSNLRDPVFGPFLRLLGSPETVERMLAGKSSENYNPVVLEFLRKAGKLPNEISTVAALFQKFVREKIDPVVGSPVDSKADPVTDLAKGGIFARIADPDTDVANSPEKPLMELAAFPKRLVVGSELNVLRVQDEIVNWGVTGGGPQLERRSGVSRINELKLTSKGGPVRAMVLEDLPNPVDSPIYPRGNAPRNGDEAKIIPRRFLEVLSEDGSPEPFTEGSGRYEMAKAIASKSNPLTARVMVNRVWMYHFGEGLVRTPDDLGNQAGKPSHAELLDFLTSWFIDDYGQGKPGWSVKGLHKAIMLSNVYQQSSRSPHMDRQKEMDSSNSLLWRANVRRLDFEAFRDSLLTMGGTMDKTLYGPAVNLVSEPYSHRRSVYGYIDRSNVPDLLLQFDMATPLEPNTKRNSTIVPQQALFLMNSPFTIGIAQKVVKRPEIVQAVSVQKDPRAGILAIFQIVLQRTPSKAEFDMALNFLQAEAKMQGSVVAATAQATATAMKQAELQLRRDQNSDGAKKAIVNEGELVRRLALSPWETLVQALMFCNEAAYLN